MTKFVNGRYASVHDILDAILTSPWNVLQIQSYCTAYHTTGPPRYNTKSHVNIIDFTNNTGMLESVQSRINSIHFIGQHICDICLNRIDKHVTLISALPLLAIDISHCKLKIDTTIIVKVVNQNAIYQLYGVIYYKNFHFTCQIIHNNKLWYHDGLLGCEMYSMGQMQPEMDLGDLRGQKAIGLVYKLFTI